MSNQSFPAALSTPEAETPTGVGDKLPSQISPSKAALAREKLEKPSGLCRVFNPPKLEKKHSSGDLISRLKTRKILGVGETDNGDIHRSKISQVLGHNEHLYVRLPRGFWVTHVCLGVEVTLEAILLLFTPTFASALGLLPPTAIEENYPTQAIRIAGAALLGFTVFIWSLLGTTDKHYARTVLMAVLTYHAISAVLSAGTAIFRGGITEHWVRASVGVRTVLCLVCLGYFHRIGEPGSGFRKSSSYRDISKDEAKDSISKLSPDIHSESEEKKEK